MMQHLRSLLLVGTGVVLGLLIAVGWHAAGSFAQGTGCQTFPQTGHTVCGKFLTYWQQHGGLAQQGYPISEEFSETSFLNGKPYTVQYFERAVFELHPENAGTPYEVELTQLGTYVGQQRFTQGFPSQQGVVPFFDHQDTPVNALESFYNAINRKEYDRAYNYFQGAPNPDPSLAPPFAQFKAGYANTASVTLAYGHVQEDAGAGNRYASMPVVITAQQTDGSTQRFSGCYFLHRVAEGITLDYSQTLWHISEAKISQAPANTSVDQLLAQTCTP